MTTQKSLQPALRSILFFAAALLGSTSPALAGVTVSLTAPTNNATFLAPANITLSATASANQGFTLSKVEFFHGTTLIGTDTSSRYSINWSNVQAASYSLTAKATAIKKNSADQTATSTPVNITVTAPNVSPTVSLTSPTEGATFNAPASITLTATASDSDGTITKVEFFHGGTNLIATVMTPPYSVLWSSVPQAAYTLTAVATDNQLAGTTSSPVNVSVGPPVAQMYFIHTDHLNTPRLVANAAGQTVWLWNQAEPFGNNAPDENPSSLGIFEFPLRFPGQYFDKETNINYNYFRDYDPTIGRYAESDPVGLKGGLSTYAYVGGRPLTKVDPTGLLGQRPGGSLARECGSGPLMAFTPEYFNGYSFTSACKAHDKCYDTCRMPKIDCDLNFYNNLMIICNGVRHAVMAQCKTRATWASQAVLLHGDGPYEDAQRKVCRECR